jgi:hypothetical protein
MSMHQRSVDVLSGPLRWRRAAIVGLVFAGCSSPQPYLGAGRLLMLPGMDGGSALVPSDANPFPEDAASDADLLDGGEDEGGADAGLSPFDVGPPGSTVDASAIPDAKADAHVPLDAH